MEQQQQHEVYQACRLETSNRLTKIETILVNQNKVLSDILEQTKKTNGRVSKLELWRESLMGKIAGISAAVSAIVGLAAWIISTFLK